MGVGSKTLAKRLDEKGLLRPKEPGKKNARKVLAGARRYVLHLHKNSLVVATEPEPRLQVEQQIAVLDVLADLTDGEGQEFFLPRDLSAELVEQGVEIAVDDLNQMLAEVWGFEKSKTTIYGAPMDAWHLKEAKIRELRKALSDSPQAEEGDDHVD